MYATKNLRMQLRAAWLVLLLLPLAVACSKGVEFASGGANAVAQPKAYVDQEFPAALIGTESLTVDPGFGHVTQILGLFEKPPMVMTLKQNERELVEEPFTQGRDGAKANEPFDVSTIGKLDLLIVVDNSASMGDEQDKLKKELGSLTGRLQSVDWQIAVITTDSSCLRNNRIIKKSDADAEAAFKSAIDAGDQGSSNERGIHFAINALNGVCEDANGLLGTPYKFLRDDASFGLLVLSDENSYCGDPETGEDSKCTPAMPTAPGELPKPGERPEDLIAKLQNLKADKARVRAYALIWDNQKYPVMCQHGGNGTESIGYRYMTVINGRKAQGGNPAVAGVGGIVGNLCANDYSAQLDNISADVSRTVKLQFSLAFAPDVKSLAITMIDDAGKSRAFTDFTIDGKSININKVDGNDRKIVVDYRYDSKPKFDRFHLSDKPLAGTLAAFINGAKVDAAKISWDDQNDEVVFGDLPPDNAVVTVKFRKGGIPLRTEFDTPWPDMDGAPVGVTVDGQTAAAAFNAAAKTIAFTTAPSDGAEIKVAYRAVGAKATQYPAQLRADVPLRHDVVATDAATGAPVDVTLTGDQLVFDAADVVDGRQVAVSYDYGDSGDVLTQELANTPMDGTVAVDAAGADGESCIDQLGVLGKTVTFHCNSDTMGPVGISYKYVAETYTRFDIQGVPAGEANWQVFVDGQLLSTSDYQRDGNTVVIAASLLTLESKVRVLVTKMEKK